MEIILGNARNNGFTENDVKYDPPQFAWSLRFQGDVNEPLIDGDGNLIITSFGKNLTCVSPEGDIVWERDLEYNPRSAAILSDGTIVVPFLKNWIHAFTKEGIQLWTYYSGLKHWSMPSVDEEDNIFIGCEDVVLKLTKDGKAKWHSDANGVVVYPPAIDAQGIIYYSDNNQIHAVSQNGLEIWKDTYKEIGQVMIINNSKIFAPGEGEIRCYDPEGRIIWRRDLENNKFGGQSATDRQGSIYTVFNNHSYSNYGGSLYSFYPNGSKRWERDIFKGSYPIIEGNGTILLSNYEGLHAYSSNGTKLWRLPMFGTDSRFVIHPNGRIYITLPKSRRLYCLGESSSTVPEGPKDVHGKIIENEGAILYCKFPRFQTYPFISKVNLYRKNDIGEYEKITVIQRYDKKWGYNDDALSIKDYWYEDRSKDRYYYFTFENRVGESDPSEIIKVAKEDDSINPLFFWVVPIFFSVMMIIMIFLAILIYRKTKNQSTHKIEYDLER